MILYLVRHGETTWHQENRYAGSTDVALTPLGIQQGQELAHWTKNADIDVIVSSDLSRAVITAEPSVKSSGLQYIIEPRFREVDFGDGEGMTTAEMRENFPLARAAFESQPAESALPNGELGNDAIERAFAALFDLHHIQKFEKILLVAHSTLGRLMLCALTGVDPNEYRNKYPEMVNGAITTIEIDSPNTSRDLYGAGRILELNALPNSSL